MRAIGVEAETERLQKRWILGALAIAFVLHALVAGAMGWYKLPGLEVPFSHSKPVGPFTVKRIEINPDALKKEQQDPIRQLPAAEPPKNPADFNLDPSAVEHALQSPQASIAPPTVPEPARIVAATDLSQNLPAVESDTAKVTAEIAQVDPSSSGGPTTTANLAQELITSAPGSAHTGVAAGGINGGDGKAGKLPGFADLAPGFKAPEATISNLPEPVLLRLPADVLFDFDSAQLKPDAASLLGQAVGMITKYPQASVQIDGYSDSFGRADYNLTLSQQRAEAVQAWLEQRVAAQAYTFRSQGHGSANYIVPTSGSIEQQQANRRVEILIQAQK
jgi:outer membrane protein OmpA-like peptidoglycan-associated protein